jgi:DNA invertase Pin-like site-specific DNA recombinase
MTHPFIDPYCYTYRYDPTQPDGKGELIRSFIPDTEEYEAMAIAMASPSSTIPLSKQGQARHSKYDWDKLVPQVQELLDKGMTVAEIAKELSINSHSLHTHLRRHPLEKERAEA